MFQKNCKLFPLPSTNDANKEVKMEKTFIEMINQHRGTIFKVCNLYCPDAVNRKDLFQEIVLQLWKSYPAFRKESTINTWLYRVSLNTAISNFRKESKTPGNAVFTDELLMIPDIPCFSDEKEKLGLLNLAIEQLTEIEKAVIMLYLDEKNYDEIGHILGITNSNVGVRLNRIKNKLSKLIQTIQP